MKKILFVSHSNENCGVYQYGKRFFGLLGTLDNFSSEFAVFDDSKSFIQGIRDSDFDAVVFNYTPGTMKWLNNEILEKMPKQLPKICLVHVEKPDFCFDYFFHLNPNFVKTSTDFPLPRPLGKVTNYYRENKNLTIGSFGFGMRSKHFDQICKIVRDEFKNEKVILRLRVTNPYFKKFNIENIKIYFRCRVMLKRSSIKLKYRINFIVDDELIRFLNENDLNIFIYDDYEKYNGISSVIDFALTSQTPFAISKSSMFQHVSNITPSIIIGERNLRDMITNPSSGLDSLRQRWSRENAAREISIIFDEIDQVFSIFKKR